MQNGYATSTSRSSRAGVTNSGPSIASRSSHSRTRSLKRARPTTGMTRAPPTAMASCPSAGDDLLHLVVGPGDGVLGGRAGDRLGQHVGQDEGVGDELHPVARGGRPTVAMKLDTLLLEGSELGVALQHGVILQVGVH